MNILKSLWPVPSETSISIPSHVEGEKEDSLDLKVKALTYFFKRFEIDRYPAFVSSFSNEYGLDLKLGKNSSNDRLDSAYNRDGFEHLILNNEHRILVDWVKNRFRSLLILSGLPSSIKDINEINYLGKELAGFKFSVLTPSDSDEKYIDIILKSGIYQEHGIDIELKVRTLKDIIQNQRDLKPSYKKTFNKDDRSTIILKYVEKLSEIVQIDRIYKASLLSKLETVTNNLKTDTLNNIDEDQELNTKTIRLSRSPVRRYSNDQKSNLSSSPVKIPPLQNARLTPSSTPIASSIKTFQDLNQSSTSLSSLASNNSVSRPPSALRSRSTSPVKTLKKKQSMTLLKMDNSLQQHTRTNSFNSDSVGPDGISKDEISILRKQSENAVLTRLEREKKLLKV